MSRVRRTLPLALYGGLTALLAPAAGWLLGRRAARGKEVAQRLTERLGHAVRERPPGPLVWLHAVSVGEAMSLVPLLKGLRGRRPDLALLVTTGTVTSAEVLPARAPGGVIHQFAPVDTPAAVRRFLDHWRPDAFIAVESELWPNTILEARARGLKLALISARMTEGSARGWARAPKSARRLLDCFDLILPQERGAAERLAGLGAKLGPPLNLKLVGEPLPFDARELSELVRRAAGRPVVLAASTHPGEEEIVARAFREAGAPGLLVVAPRHVERGPQVEASLAALGFSVSRRQGGGQLEPGTDVYLADTLGELGLFFRLADVVVMGGGFAPGIGGHNPLEPARLSKPVVTGPHVFNAREVYDELLAEAACIEAADEAALARHIRGLVDYPMIRRRMGEAAFAYAQRKGQALDAALAVLEPLLPA